MANEGEDHMDRALQIAWAAGFLDGDGWISIEKTRDGFQVRVEAAQGREEPLLVLRNLFGGNIGTTKNQHGVYLRWTAKGEAAGDILRELLPYLVVKRQQAALAIAFTDTISRQKTGNGFYYGRVSPGVKAMRATLYAEIKGLNLRRDHAERLSERAPHLIIEVGDDATVRPVEN